MVAALPRPAPRARLGPSRCGSPTPISRSPTRLADAAGAAIRPLFPCRLRCRDQGRPVARSRSPTAPPKQAMRTLLAAEAPRDGIVGEEFGTSEGSTGRQWVLDPIDGTRAFIAGRPIFGTLIALVDRRLAGDRRDRPADPARNAGSARSGGRRRSTASPPARARCRELAEALLATTSPALFGDDELHAFEHLDAAVRSTVLGGDCYNYACARARAISTSSSRPA